MKYETIFLDLDDTLIDTSSNNYEALTEIFTEYGFDNDYETFDDFYEVFKPYNLSLWKLYEQNRINKEDLKSRRFYEPFKHIEKISQKRALEINNDFMFRSSSKRRLIDGAIELLEALKPKFKIIMLSNGFEEVQYKKLEMAGLEGYFDKVILSDQAGVNKPNPLIFEFALSESNASKEKTVMIGDNWISDITGARNSGIDQMWYAPNEYNKTDFEPTYVIKELSEAIEILL
ncbi:noncanonical pyrimidine nucleotidase, YjjG family [Dysgonomonas sp. 216]|uniref:YjjG family noncanonical pyrimidine nucleotidase n=1 Tax=Dysgonomonas sp. 216 TaxID=2302934 RepID=UPI0013D06893|nr:YjjG family noncanonical pyrimidine nucleotidase [Dysgonomonas sp. 216]NDW18095.1 noncanonical pyrimidine nucleotidase, YjjG family [Dysgonomonas sp. 216]